MGLKLNTQYMTKLGGLKLLSDGKKLIILSRYKPCKLDIRKVRKHGLLNYIHHVSAAQARTADNPYKARQKYDALKMIILRIQQGAYRECAPNTKQH